MTSFGAAAVRRACARRGGRAPGRGRRPARSPPAGPARKGCGGASPRPGRPRGPPAPRKPRPGPPGAAAAAGPGLPECAAPLRSGPGPFPAAQDPPPVALRPPPALRVPDGPPLTLVKGPRELYNDTAPGRRSNWRSAPAPPLYRRGPARRAAPFPEASRTFRKNPPQPPRR